MSELETLMTRFAVDLSLRPTTFDLWHVSLAAAVVALMALLILLLLAMLFTRRPSKEPSTSANFQRIEPTLPQPVEPTVKIIEKIVEVEKIVPAPSPR